MSEHVGIRCPRCGWRPSAQDRWHCVPSCGTEWNTFWTRGICPGCAVTWPRTQCHACHAFSPREAWYRRRTPGPGEAALAAAGDASPDVR